MMQRTAAIPNDSSQRPGSAPRAKNFSEAECMEKWLEQKLQGERHAIDGILSGRHQLLLADLRQSFPFWVDDLAVAGERISLEAVELTFDEPLSPGARSSCSMESKSQVQQQVIGTTGGKASIISHGSLDTESTWTTGETSWGDQCQPKKPVAASNLSSVSPILEEGVKVGDQRASEKEVPLSPTRSFVYGDRPPELSMWHVDCSSLQAFVSGPCFESFYAGLIFLNTIFLCVENQFQGWTVGDVISFPGSERMYNAEVFFIVAEWFFGILFSVELGLKVASLKWKFVKDCWNWLDCIVVLCWIFQALESITIPIDPMFLRITRLAKLLRLVKLAKTVNAFDSLYLLTASIKSSVSALVWSAVLICILQILTALGLSTFLIPFCLDKNNPEEDRWEVYRYFGTFTRSMLSMFELTLGNWVPISRLLSERVSEWYTIFTMVFQVVLGFAVIKVITGVFLTETMKVASMDDSIMLKTKQRAMRLHKQKMSRLFEHADTDGSGVLDEDEFRNMLSQKDVRAWLASMDLDVETEDHEKALFHLLDSDGGGLVCMDEMIAGVARLKGPARNIDLSLLGQEMRKLTSSLSTLESNVSKLLGRCG
eukprot:TRINITY_DN109258_c0_g1_i1.p1 TRINITY_DN109258_c0_g1~~TRINITY_DN109258_c0_g1_i1.p1  ORF type:complete len:598 (+),score=102.23 TRINITY_DN109258_c0_g1_i1:57-1850(+)